jgi:cephalosporin-C deacetylase-like acetyl esterase
LKLDPPPATRNVHQIKWIIHLVDDITYASITISDYNTLAENNKEMEAWRKVAVDQLKQYLDQKQVIIKVEENGPQHEN